MTAIITSEIAIAGCGNPDQLTSGRNDNSGNSVNSVKVPQFSVSDISRFTLYTPIWVACELCYIKEELTNVNATFT